MEEELNSLKTSRRKISQQIDDTLIEVGKQDAAAINKFNQLSEEYTVTIDENKLLNDEIKAKDDIIKTLTKENLLINSKVTQLTALLYTEEDR
jgi:predicted  nucleic acid-binding Zn-ribbon protein